MSYSPYFLNQNSKGSSRSTVTGFQNASGSTLAQTTLVSVNASSQLLPTMVDSETLVQAIVGVTDAAIPNGTVGAVVDNGRLEEITTPYAIGDAIYLAKNGSFTNVKPNIGAAGFVSGDFVIFIGVIVKNEFNNTKTDLKLAISVIGQL